MDISDGTTCSEMCGIAVGDERQDNGKCVAKRPNMHGTMVGDAPVTEEPWDFNSIADENLALCCPF
jgi:hypothetical protein